MKQDRDDAIASILETRVPGNRSASHHPTLQMTTHEARKPYA